MGVMPAKSILWSDIDEPCTHDDPPVYRVAHGYLGDAPAGTVETLCGGCGCVLPSRTDRVRPFCATEQAP